MYELHADGHVYNDVLTGIPQQTGNFIAFVHLDDIAVAAGGKQVFAVRGDVELARMDAGKLVTHLGKCAILRIDGKDGDAVRLQTVAGIEVFTVGAEVDIRTATGSHSIGNNGLYLFAGGRRCSRKR